MTSNALGRVEGQGDREIRELLFNYRDMHGSGLAEPKFRREFIDRLEIILFSALEQRTLARIALREIKRVISQVNESDIMRCELKVEDEVADWITGRVDSESNGARSVQRLVEGSISRLIADRFIQGEIQPGRSYILGVDAQDKFELHVSNKIKEVSDVT
jgi:ATP-dependent Clp protease ATP-binding subunit ClpA